MQDRRQPLAAIRRIAQAGQGDQTLEELSRRVCDEIAAACGFDHVALARRSGEATTPLAVTGEPRTECVSVPLVHQDEVTGELTAAPPPSGDDAELLDTIAAVVASLLEPAFQRDDLRRLDAAKTQFIAFASHELRTPIQAVYGMLATLHLRGPQLRADQLVELRSVAYEQADRLRQLVEQLLDISRLDAAVVGVSPRPTQLRRLVEEIVLLVAERRAHQVRIEVPDDLEMEVDPVAVDRIVSNLLTNALRYGAPPVRIDANRSDHHLRLGIEDSGTGVPPEFIPILFERFTRSDRTAAGADGSGLGLSIAQAYANAHGGGIVYSDAKPHGARFEVVIPVAR
jgi:two-component system sensor histidine kinase MtrB